MTANEQQVELNQHGIAMQIGSKDGHFICYAKGKSLGTQQDAEVILSGGDENFAKITQDIFEKLPEKVEFFSVQISKKIFSILNKDDELMKNMLEDKNCFVSSNEVSFASRPGEFADLEPLPTLLENVNPRNILAVLVAGIDKNSAALGKEGIKFNTKAMREIPGIHQRALRYVQLG